MTFYELEKICKARKRRFYFFIFLMILLVFGVMGYILFNLYGVNEPIIKKIEKKEVNKTKSIKPKQSIIKEKPEIKQVKKEVKKLNFILPSFEEIEKKEIKPKEKVIKTVKEKNSSKILIADNIPSFETCINLAQIYLKNKDYKNALKWAKFANIQNKENPLSWIISAKALYALGKKEKAIKLLEIYNSYSKNKEVEKLIKEFNEK